MTEFDAAFGAMPMVDQSWIASLVSLLLLPFAHEDLAIVLGSYFVVSGTMSVPMVASGLYAGMVASDVALYGLGACARRVPWLQRYAVDDRVQRFGSKLRRNIFLVVALCRIVPGVVFFAFVACGWTRVSLMRFSVASIVVSAIYLPLTLYVVIVFGDLLDDMLGMWAWPLVFAAMISAALFRKKVFGSSAQDDEAAPARTIVFDGMPPLSSGQRRVAAAERIPPFLFYIPLVLNWVWLGFRHRSLTLPTAANPRILTGGMWGESKSGYIASLDPDERKWIADTVVVERHSTGDFEADATQALAQLDAAGIGFPIVAKPDVGWHGYGVQRICDRDALMSYIRQFPAGAALILQRFVPYAGEAAILYSRLPGDEHGRIESLTLRYFPHVVGDGCTAVGDLIRRDARASWKARLHLGADPTHRGVGFCDLKRVPAEGEVVQIALIGNQRAGGLYRDVTNHVTPLLVARIDAIARAMPEFHYGRFDLRFKSIEALRRAEDFAIVEINGIGGEAIDAWDPTLTVRETYRRLFVQQRLLFAIGDRSRSRGARPTAVADFVAPLFQQTELIGKYPPSQ